jgi:hypothetical protein
MDFKCPELSESIKSRISENTKIRYGVVDRFLTDQFGEAWLLRPRLVQSELNFTLRKNLWEIALQSNFLLRSFKEGRHDSALPSEELTVDAFQFQAGNHSFCLLGKSKIVVEDLKTAWHPKFNGREIFPRCIDYEEGWKKTQKALQILEPYPEFISLIRNECGALCFIDSKPPMKDGQCISLTSKLVPGLVYVSAAPTILLAESLVHEAAHLRFRAVEEVTDLYLDGPNMLVLTPLRTDPRPVSGFMHQLLVLRYLVALYDKYRFSDLSVISGQRSQVEKRYAQHLQDFETGMCMVKNVQGALTQEGRQLLESLGNFSESTLV